MNVIASLQALSLWGKDMNYSVGLPLYMVYEIRIFHEGERRFQEHGWV